MTDTLILGGGLAGAAAALWLADHGHSATIIEARPRLGGRAHSRHWGAAGLVEYGGGWVRKDHALIQGLCQRLGIALTPRAPLAAHSHFLDGQFRATPSDDMPAHDAAIAQLLADAALMGADSPQARAFHAMTLQGYLDHRAFPASVRREILAWWTISGSGAPDRIGVNEYLTPKIAKGLMVKLDELAFTIAGGVGSIVRAAVTASGAKVVLGDAVERLEEAETGVRATLASGAGLTGRTALVALPVNALAQVRFSPPLTPGQQAIRRRGHGGRAIKLLIRARGPRPGHLATGETRGIRWLYADRALTDGSTLLIGFGLQDEVGEPDRSLVDSVLQAAFPGAGLLDFDWHDWAADPFARGSWVSPYLDTLPSYDPDHWAPRGRLAFAGSDLYSAEQGWFEGALLTANAAVQALNQRLEKA